MQCRACMQLDESGDVVEMGSLVPDGTKTFYDYFNDCTQLQANSMDRLTQWLCSTCSQILQVAYAFVRDARQSYKKLKEILEMQEAEEVLMYCKTEQIQLSEYDPLIEPLAIDVVFDTSMQQSEPIKRENNMSSKNLSVGSSQIEHSLSSLKVELEGDEEDLVEYFVCSLCSSKFKLNKTYLQHMKNVHSQIISPSHDSEINETSLYECEVCNYISKSRSNLYIHKKRKHPPLPPPNASEFLKEHVKPPYNEECTLCSCTFTSKQSYQKHFKETHGQNVCNKENEKEWACDICNMTFKYRSSIYKHKRYKHPETLVKTTKLNNFIFTSNTLATEAAEEDENSYFAECKYCHKQISKEKIKDHEYRHRYHQKRQKRFLCESCPRVYQSQQALWKHVRVCHIKPPPEECPVCKNKFRNLKLHIKNMHTPGEFKCAICGASFKNNERLYCHKIRHLERKHACNFCEKKFVRSSELRVHLRNHTGEHPFACHLCNRTFKIKVHLTHHVQRHAGIKRRCNDCGKEFDHLKQLWIHSFKHTGMPYKCPICEYGCVKRDTFVKHLLRMHDMNMTDEELCDMFKENTGRYPYVKTITNEELIEAE